MVEELDETTDSPAVWETRFLPRRDLQYARCADKHDTWNVFDSITRQSTRVGLLEYLLLSRVDGRRPLGEIARSLADEQLPFEPSQLAEVAMRLRAMGLLRDGSSQSGTSNPVRTFQQVVSGFVVWQVRGINPDSLLRSIAPKCGFLFSRAAVVVWSTLILATAAADSFDFVRMCDQTATWQDMLLGGSGLAFGGWLFTVFLVTRGLHELGHAVVCYRQGVRCPDIGLLFIMCAPCVYCDVSESWRLPRRSQRAAVAAGGMYIELVVATVASWVWLSTVDSPVNTLALQTMCVCSISTILVNANPLMRFDGYYILADWLDEVNLRSKADRLLSSKVADWVLGRSASRTRSHAIRRDAMLMMLSAAGWVYRSFLALAIAGGITMLWSSWNLVWVGRTLGCAILISWWGIPMVGFVKSLGSEAKNRGRRVRLAIATAALVLAIALLPVPTRRIATGWVRPKMMQGIYAGETATLVACNVEDGVTVTSGQELFEFRDEDLATVLISASAAQLNARTQYASMRRTRDMYGYDIDLTPFATRSQALKKQVDATQKRYDQLKLTAVVGGTIIAAEASAPRRLSDVAGLPPVARSASAYRTWCSSEQIGRTVGAGTLLASIRGDEFLAVIPLTPEQLRYVTVGTPCKLRLMDAKRTVASCKVNTIVRLNRSQAMSQADWGFANESGQPRPSSAAPYAAVVDMPTEFSDNRFCDEAVDVVFHTETTSIYLLTRTWLQKNLRFLSQ
ncbi:MAG: biotin/lipoyl-binding protein [Aureliella sp.]